MPKAKRPYNPIHSPVPVLIMAVAVFMLALAARATTVTGFSDLVSRLQISTPANHEIKFVTATGVEANTDTITLTFESNFDLSRIDPDDIDLGVDNDAVCDGTFTVRSATNTPAAGVWGAAVSGQTLTLTAPSVVGIEGIPANRCVRILIGTNATDNAGDGDQIINP